uniref:Uncharacterized protein n=1 Tax=Glossina brevipalpis TaxID=37001 RepID=A0A1A9WT81_9MUSC
MVAIVPFNATVAWAVTAGLLTPNTVVTVDDDTVFEPAVDANILFAVLVLPPLNCNNYGISFKEYKQNRKVLRRVGPIVDGNYTSSIKAREHLSRRFECNYLETEVKARLEV